MVLLKICYKYVFEVLCAHNVYFNNNYIFLEQARE
jgi:hypothetical protein